MNAKSLVSITKTKDGFSVDIRPFEKGGIAAPCGGCRLFRFVGDGLIWITQHTGKDIPSHWPNLETYDWQFYFNETI